MQQLFQIPLLFYNPHTLWKYQFKHQRDMSHHMIHRRSLDAAQRRVMFVKAIHHCRCDGCIAQFLRRGIINLLQRHIHIDPQNINLVSIPQDMAQLFRARHKPLRNPVGTVHSYGSLNDLILRHIVHIRADQTFPFLKRSAKQNICSERCMIDGICIAECPVSPELLKSSHIVQHSKKPCQVDLCLLHPLRLRDPLAQFRHPVSVVYFQFYFLIGRIISIRIFPECFSDPFTLDFHLPVSPSDFLILFPCPVGSLFHTA